MLNWTRFLQAHPRLTEEEAKEAARVDRDKCWFLCKDIDVRGSVCLYMKNGKVYTIMGKQERLELLQKFKSLVLSSMDQYPQ